MGRLSWRAGGALLLFLCIVVAGTAALTDQEIERSPSPGTLQITAGDGGGTIDVTINNGSVTVDKVTFEYLNASSDPTGTLSVTSDTEKHYQAVFSSEKAGNATIGITVDSHDNHSSMRTSIDYPVRVIPSDPYAYMNLTYNQTVPVGETTPITVRMVDKFGNVINGETGATIDFVFLDTNLTQPFDEYGNCTVTLKAPTTASTILIGIYPGYGKYLDRIISIDVVSLRIPNSIDSDIKVVAPDGSTIVSNICMADGISFFDVGYVVSDEFGNPIANYPVYFTTTMGGTQTLITGMDGKAHAKVGPQKTLGSVTVTGKAGTYTKTDLLTFAGGSAQGYGLSVNPSDIPSYEVDPTVRAAIQARVFNAMGTGVENETIDFAIMVDNITNNTPMINGPELSYSSAKTDENGYATVYLQPGEFPGFGSPDFYHSAIGSCQVKATWNGSPKTSPVITWRNYPYLRVETNVSKSVVAPGETIDVTIRLIGDGNEFQNPGNISLVLCLDRGEDMLLDEMEGVQRDRMLAAREAAMHLVEGGDELEPTSTNVALVTYGDPTTNTDIYPKEIADYLTIPANSGATFWKKVGTPGDDDKAYILEHYPGNGNISYPFYSKVDREFDTANNDWEYLRTALNKTVPVKGVKDLQVSAPIRDGLKTSIDYLKNSNPGDTRAIVLLMQNSYRYFGDPLARPGGDTLTYNESIDVKLEKNTRDYFPYNLTNESMAAYAAENNIVIYAIYYSTGNAQGELETAQILTQSTGGQLFVASSYSELVDAFEQTKADIQRKAGIDTSVHLSFAEVPENFTYTSTQLLNYESPTYIDFYNWSVSPYIVDNHLPGYYKDDINQTDMWLGTTPGTSPGTLEFDVGNISVKQTWMTKFSFTINNSISEPLNFTLFGGDSNITFENEDGSTLTQFLPPIMVTVIPDLAPQALFDATVDVSMLPPTHDEPFTKFSWQINYTGQFPMEQHFYIRKMDGDDTSWKKIGSMPLPKNATYYELSLFTDDMETGLYEAKTRVSTADAGYAEDTKPFGVGIFGVDYYIRLS
ncbi:MAG TPA: hypothetical protein ENN44_04320 [Methanoculleus sp.]|nr:hypothetical protein [Methanoculleus sp.]